MCSINRQHISDRAISCWLLTKTLTKDLSYLADASSHRS